METPTKNCIPPVIRVRNEHGLYTDLDYVFLPNGDVDWRKMIPAEFIVPNKDKTQETDVSKLEDKDLLILLEGFQKVADIRGHQSVDTIITSGATSEFVSARTLIVWEPN